MTNINIFAYISKKTKILIIEDEVKIINFIKIGLEMDHYSVDLAYDGKEGLAKAESGEYDLIILDVMLPEMNGLEVCKRLRRKKITTPIIMLTARDTDEDRISGLNAGANHYLVKPFAFSDLSISIKESLRQHHETTTSLTPTPQKRSDESNQEVEIIVEDIAKKLSSDDVACALNKNILDNAPISIVTIDKNGFITSTNHYYRNFSKSDTKNRINHNIFEGDFFIRENLLDDYKKLLSDGIPFKKENCCEINSKGEIKYLKIIATPFKDEAGNITGALSMAIDNTEVITFKNRLLELSNNLESIVRKRTVELKKANRELKKALNLKSIFMADVSHELRTALAIILGNFELMIRKNIINEQGKSSCDQIFNEIERISTMLSDVNLVTNPNSATQQLSFNKTNITEIIAGVCKSLEVIAAKKNVNINFNSTTDIELIADKNKLEKLFQNIIKNAITYNKNNGWIDIILREDENNITVKVIDGGMGISIEHLPLIFERFYRADRARTRNENGSGLGLAISKWVVEKHNGSIHAESQIDVGSTFTIQLPKKQATTN